MDFDETRLYYSHQQLQQSSTTVATANAILEDDHEDQAAAFPNEHEDDTQSLAVPTAAMRRHFREFFRT